MTTTKSVEIKSSHAGELSLIRIALSLYFWAFFLFLTMGVSLLIIFIGFCNRLFFKGRRRSDRLAHNVANFWGHWAFKSVPGWEVHIEGIEHLDQKNEPYVITCNHESMADIWAAYLLNTQFRWIAKDSLFKLPIVGPAMREVGYVSLARGHRDSHSEAIEQSRQILRQGTNMFFFPEGTRSTDGIKRFKVGAFKLAKEENRPILPVVIHGAAVLLPKKSWLIATKARVDIAVLEPIDPSVFQNMDYDDIGEYTRALIIKKHDEIVAKRQQNVD